MTKYVEFLVKFSHNEDKIKHFFAQIPVTLVIKKYKKISINSKYTLIDAIKLFIIMG